ncbi:hypothetical protein AB3S75_045171 [Citrus x aurantiifolia]
MSEVTSETTPTLAAAIPEKTSETLQNYSNSHSVQITTIRLNGDNFLCRSQSVLMYIRGQGKIGYITCDKKVPANDDLLYATWDAENSTMYSDLGNQSQVFELTLMLGEIHQEDDYLTKYFNSLKRLWQDLDLFNTYEWKSVDDCNYHKKIVEDSRIYKFLTGLNVEFAEVRGRIIGRPPLPPIGEVFAE